MLSVFSRVGFVHTEAPSREWDVLWSHDYPFGGKYSNILQSLDLHQKVGNIAQTCNNYLISIMEFVVRQ